MLRKCAKSEIFGNLAVFNCLRRTICVMKYVTKSVVELLQTEPNERIPIQYGLLLFRLVEYGSYCRNS